ncbi:MAG: hypothetical protein MZV70_33085 [Desulfobacterales bacterium]|nr:hypothetical protein [Desulfobacterales bacterium]
MEAGMEGAGLEDVYVEEGILVLSGEPRRRLRGQGRPGSGGRDQGRLGRDSESPGQYRCAFRPRGGEPEHPVCSTPLRRVEDIQAVYSNFEQAD